MLKSMSVINFKLKHFNSNRYDLVFNYMSGKSFIEQRIFKWLHQNMSVDVKIRHFWKITALTGYIQFTTICCLNTVSQHKIPCKLDLSYCWNTTQLRKTWLEDSELHLQNKGNLTHSQSTLHTFHTIIETHSPSVWLSLAVNIEWLG